MRTTGDLLVHSFLYFPVPVSLKFDKMLIFGPSDIFQMYVSHIRIFLKHAPKI